MCKVYVGDKENAVVHFKIEEHDARTCKGHHRLETQDDGSDHSSHSPDRKKSMANAKIVSLMSKRRPGSSRDDKFVHSEKVAIKMKKKNTLKNMKNSLMAVVKNSVLKR